MSQQLSGHIVCGDRYAEVELALDELHVGHFTSGEVVTVDDPHVVEPILRRLTRFVCERKMRATLSWENPNPNETRRIIVMREGVAVTFESIPIFAPIDGPQKGDDLDVYESIVRERQKMESDILRNLYEGKLPERRRSAAGIRLVG